MRNILYYRLKGLLCRTGAKWDKQSVTWKNAVTYAHANINPEPEVYMKNTLHYTWEGCLARYSEDISWRYRWDRPDADDLAIADMVESHSTQVPLILYRGVCEDVFQLMLENAEELEDTDLYEKGFMPTSLVKGSEILSDYQLRIHVPAGAHVVYLGNVNNELSRYPEVVIQRGSKLRIHSICGGYINCELIL